MLRVVLDLVNNPGAEDEPEPWLTRLFAHMAVGGCLFVLAMVLTSSRPTLSAFCACAIYAGVEVIEWVLARGRRNLALLLDCAVDWLAVSFMTGMFWSAWMHNTALMAGFMAAAFIMAQIGVSRRMRLLKSAPDAK